MKDLLSHIFPSLFVGLYMDGQLMFRFLFLMIPCFPFVYFAWQNQFFISGLSGDEIICNRVLDALYRRIMRAFNDKKCFRVIIVLPLLPGFQVLVFIQLAYIKVLYGSSLY